MADAGAIDKILFITLSNLGDCLMSLPAFDFLRREYPKARITVVVSDRTRCVFENHPGADEVVVFDKRAPLARKIALFFEWQRKGFDCVVDLKNTFYRWGLRAPFKNPAFARYPEWCRHDSQRHLYQAILAVGGHDLDEASFDEYNSRRNPSFIQASDHEHARVLLEKNGITGDEYVLLVPGARSSLKRWDQAGYLEVGRAIVQKYGFRVVVIGDASEEALVRDIASGVGQGAVGLAGRTTFGQLAALAARAKIVIANDSGVLHIASYLDKLVVGIYGPSDYVRYGPWSKRGFVVRKNVLCGPCGKAHCFRDRACITTISPYDVMLAIRLIMEGPSARLKEGRYRRILVSRTDRIGDVVLSTPVLKALREHYPSSFIAMMVSPATRDIVEGNPYLDEVITFDKDRSGSLWGTVHFAKRLRDKKFDVVVVLHPTVRVHLLMFLAGIRERIGYDRKGPYFLTTTVPHRKQLGERHEAEYNFDLLKPLGIEETALELFMPIRPASERIVEEVLRQAGVENGSLLIAVNPSASCVSKLWPVSKFAEVIDALAARYRAKVAIVSDESHRALSEELLGLTKSMPLDLSGRFNLSELASFLKRCALVVSNDSGPVHLASAVGTPVISIFGRNQPGLGPRRWGPRGPQDVFLHKTTACAPCLAHACEKDFQCLQAVTVEEVLAHAARILGKERTS